MGCCESTVRRATASPPLLSPPPDHTELAPSSAMEVEEKVKEVLCETPAASKPVAPPNHEPALPAKTDLLKLVPPPEKPMSVPEDSKFRGISQTTAAANADGTAQRRAERSPVKPRPPPARSFSGELGAGVGRGSGKSPTRIRPDGMGGSVRIVQSRDAGLAQRLDLGVGERSGRRSGPGSPAKRGSVNGGGTKPAPDRVPSMRRADLSPGRARRDPNGGGSSKRMTGGDSKQRRESKGRESLESPLVSLECFIFL